MHIVIGFLTSVVTILWLLHRLAEMGIDLGGLNPFFWRRRRAWRKKYQADPIYSLDDPMEVAAVVVVAIAKLDGDISAEEKAAAIAEFARSFSLDDKAALQLFGAASHLLGQAQVIDSQVEGLLHQHKNLFTGEQIESVLAMMTRVASTNDSLTEEQQSYLSKFKSHVRAPAAVAEGTWANKA